MAPWTLCPDLNRVPQLGRLTHRHQCFRGTFAVLFCLTRDLSLTIPVHSGGPGGTRTPEVEPRLVYSQRPLPLGSPAHVVLVGQEGVEPPHHGYQPCALTIELLPILFWWTWVLSRHRPPVLQTGALPTELQIRVMAVRVGIEPTIVRLTAGCLTTWPPHKDLHHAFGVSSLFPRQENPARYGPGSPRLGPAAISSRQRQNSFWGVGWDSNPHGPGPQPGALPVELPSPRDSGSGGGIRTHVERLMRPCWSLSSPRRDSVLIIAWSAVTSPR